MIANNPAHEYTFRQAIVQAIKHNKSLHVIDAIYNAVRPLCNTETDGNGGNETTLYEWLESGEYHKSDTPQSIAAEWDNLNEQAS